MIRAWTMALACASVLVALAGCAGDAPPSARCPQGNPHVALETTVGDIVVELFADAAPKTVGQFLSLVEEGGYDGTIFHDVRNSGGNQLMLGGDRTRDGTVRTRDLEPVPPERDIPHDRAGRLSWGANGRFFIMFAPLESYDESHNAFGQVVVGMDVVAMVQTTLALASGEPLHPIVMGAITAGCKELAARMQANLVSPGLWDVRGADETNMIWAHNGQPERVDAEWSVTGSAGQPLPQGWTFTFDDAAVSLAANASAVPPGGGLAPDWTWTMAHLRLPEGARPGDYPLVLRVGTAAQPFIVRVHENQTEVAQVGDEVRVSYGSRRVLEKTQVDSGTVDVTVGGSGMVTGLAYGLAGMAVNEQLVLHLPAALAFGYDLPEDHRNADLEGVALEYLVVRRA